MHSFSAPEGKYPGVIVVPAPKARILAVVGLAAMLTAAALGAERFGAVRSGAALQTSAEVLVLQWCSQCQRRMYPVAPAVIEQWAGKTREELSALLARDYPQAAILSFAPDQAVVQFPPALCAQCSPLRWPERGYIGLTADNNIAVYDADGVMIAVYGVAPGSFLHRLAEGIPFSSPEECENLLIDITS
ncbi:MAG: hypothetical protein GX090_01565 [Firmicutes bacterium]|nr:hypothetical protein [Bacillota bacterium]HPZ90761.1 hypothetical protein [Bacillota bacterium]